MRTAHSSSGLALPAEMPQRSALPEGIDLLLLIAPRTGQGASLLARLLDSHPAIHARSDEFAAFTSAEQAAKSIHDTMTGAELDATLSLRRGGVSPLRVVCGCIDSETAVSIDCVRASLPTSKAVALIRDGRDAIVSERLASLRSGAFGELSLAGRAHAAAAAAFVLDRSTNPAPLFCAESLRRHVAAWTRSLRGAMRARDMMGEQVRVIRYEDLVLETIRTHASICRWLGVAGDAALVHGAIEASRSQLAAAERPGAWKMWFSEADRIAFKRMAGELLIELGYEKDLRW